MPSSWYSGTRTRCCAARSAGSATSRPTGCGSRHCPPVVNGHRPSAITTNGSATATLVHPAARREQHAVLVVEVNPVLAPVLAVRDELEVPAEQWMKPVRHPHTSVQIIQTGCS